MFQHLIRSRGEAGRIIPAGFSILAAKCEETLNAAYLFSPRVRT